MKWRLVITERSLRALVRELAWGGLAFCAMAAGVNRLERCSELLVCSGPGRAADLQPRQALVVVVGARRSGEFPERIEFGRQVREAMSAQSAIQAEVVLGLELAGGQLAGRVWVGSHVEPLIGLRVVGGGLREVRLDPDWLDQTPGGQARQIWSRTIGALGERAWLRLTELEFVLVGCSRSGSLMAEALVRNGVRRLVLIDPDRLEEHNLGEMGLAELADIGKPKVKALQERLATLARAIRPEGMGRARIEALALPVTSPAALEAMKRADFLLSCVDSDAARLAVGLAAKLYLKPMLDVGTGIFQRRHGEQTKGIDVRLVLPDASLLCVGGLNRVDEAARDLLGDARTVNPRGDWREQRAGSLRSLNMVAVGLGLQLIEELVAGRLNQSIWLHGVAEAGLPSPVLPECSKPGSHSASCAITAGSEMKVWGG